MAKAAKQPEEKQEMKSKTVKRSFRDKDNFDRKYEVGEDVSHFDEKRLRELKDKGFIH